ncbi:MAG: hypothetical protein J07HQX50_02512 [Haloquadratum sp. J07HQX50]|jgi:DNA primase (bacterial type)|nr:MAG: hypothetical protein J07HQX50_02512 [Haloquadratum sp. J07HQX50]
MNDSDKYLINAAITADGVVERSDVVGAIFGQTEGLLGEELDLRDLQQSSKTGRIDVDIDSQNGQSYGTVTIASSLDRVQTALLAAALETITRVGPCGARVEITEIKDVREAKREQVIARAKELLSESFDESVMSSAEIREEVKDGVRAESIEEYHGVPAGPRVEHSDAIIIVEGRADVMRLLQFGIKNALAVEGTNIPEPVAHLTTERTTTTFFDNDRGGNLILKELEQTGSVDYVASAPAGKSVENLDREEAFAALRNKVPQEQFSLPESTEAIEHKDSKASESVGVHRPLSRHEQFKNSETTTSDTETNLHLERNNSLTESVPQATPVETVVNSDALSTDSEDTTTVPPSVGEPASLASQVKAVIESQEESLRLLDQDYRAFTEERVSDVDPSIINSGEPAHVVILGTTVTQPWVDVAAAAGVETVIGTATAEYVKMPVKPRIRTADELI